MILLVVLLFEDAAFLFGVTSQCTDEVEPDERITSLINDSSLSEELLT